MCLTLFPWAKFRRAKGGVKAHVLLDHDDYLPAFVLTHRSQTPRRRRFSDPLRLAAVPSWSWTAATTTTSSSRRWIGQGVFFVTRMKENAVYEVVERRAVPHNRNILSDEIIRLTGVNAESECPHPLRRIVVWDAENQREIVLLTNHLEFGATTLAAIYGALAN